MSTVFVDIDTQIDFLFPAGALYVPGAEKLLPALGRLNRHAAANGIPVLSSADAHSEDDPEFRQWPAHCVAGTAGQQKAQDTLLDKRVVAPNRPVEIDIRGAQQAIVEKQALDVFTNVNLGRLLDLWNAGEYVVYGVVTEHCVRCAAMGLLQIGRRVIVVEDAIQTLEPAAAQRFLEQFRQAGGRVARVADICPA